MCCHTTTLRIQFQIIFNIKSCLLTSTNIWYPACNICFFLSKFYFNFPVVSTSTVHFLNRQQANISWNQTTSGRKFPIYRRFIWIGIWGAVWVKYINWWGVRISQRFFNVGFKEAKLHCVTCNNWIVSLGSERERQGWLFTRFWCNCADPFYVNWCLCYTLCWVVVEVTI